MRTRAGVVWAAVRSRVGRVVGMPGAGVAVIVPLVLVVAAGASAPSPEHVVADDGITPVAAVARAGEDSGVVVVAADRAPRPLRVAVATVSAPPPPVVVRSVGGVGIPAIALSAYRNAERMMAGAYPRCGVSWNLLAGIGRIESEHANGGATDAHGTAVPPIYGPALDGTLAGNEVIVQTVQAGRVSYAKAMGPMQFLPGTWARYASDGNGDGTADIQNVYDASLAAARYLCSGNLNLRDQSQVLTAILRYNNSMAYAQNVLGWAAAYATGVAPIDLPPIQAAPPLGDAHLDAKPEGLGPGLPLTATGLPGSDSVATLPLDDPNGTSPLGAVPRPTGGAALAPPQNCQVFCLTPPAQTRQQDCQVFCLTPPPGPLPVAPEPLPEQPVAPALLTPSPPPPPIGAPRAVDTAPQLPAGPRSTPGRVRPD